jgi:hypothetical protein
MLADRVVLYEDMKPYLSYFSHPSSQIRLLIRMLEALGIHAPRAQSSASFSSWASGRSSGTPSRSFHGCELFAAAMETSTGTARPSSLAAAVKTVEFNLYQGYLSQELSAVDVILASLQKTTSSTLIADHETMSTRITCKQQQQQLSSSSSPPSHIDLKYDFILRLLRGCLSQMKDQAHRWSRKLQIELWQGCLSLEIQCYEIEQLNAVSLVKSINHLIQEVKAFVQQQAAAAAADDDDDSSSMSLWCSYLQLEARYGDHASACKVGDKLLMAMQQKYLSYSKHREVSIADCELILSLASLSLGLLSQPTRTSSNSYASSTAAAIAIIVAFTNQSIDPKRSYLRRDGKPSKQPAPPPTIDPASCSLALNAMMELISSAMIKLQHEVEGVRASLAMEMSIHATRMKHVEHLSSSSINAVPMIYYPIALAAWLLCLMENDLQSSDQLLVSILKQLLELLLLPENHQQQPWSEFLQPLSSAKAATSSSFFNYDKSLVPSEASLAYCIATKPMVASLAATTIGNSILILIEAVCFLRLQQCSWMLKHCPKLSRSYDGLLAVTLQGLALFPWNASLLTSLWAIEGSRAGGYLRMKSHLSCQAQRVIYGSGLSATERLFAVFIEVARNDIHARDEAAVLCKPSKSMSWSTEDRERLLRVLEDMIHDHAAQTMPWLWRYYLHLQPGHVAGKKLWYRGTRRCAMNKRLWLEAWSDIGFAMTERERHDIKEIILQHHGLHLRFS